MRDPVSSLLEQRRSAVLDGGLATELEARGADIDDPLWSAKVLVEDPDSIGALHFDYLEAGADVATSASYQASFEGFAARGLDDDEAVRVMRRSVELAKAACRRRGRGLAAASIGPYGAYLHDGSEYRGDYTLDAQGLHDFHRRRMETLASAEPDLMAFETIPSPLEAKVLTDLAERLEVPCWVSFSCRNDHQVSHGEDFADCVRNIARSPAVVAIGVNCCPPGIVSGLLRAARGATTKPLLAYPNSGETWDGEHHSWLGTPESVPLEEHSGEWRELGARLIGGCCRTTPATIRRIASRLAQRNKL